MFSKIVRIIVGLFVLYSMAWGIAIWAFDILPEFVRLFISILCIGGSSLLALITALIYCDERGDEMDHENKEVYFGQYCKSCEHYKKNEHENPCEECLDNPINLQSHKPIKWEEKSSSK